ncbi:ABC transporter integral membrane type 1 [Penicillium cf. griseofulvum]|nr:ABC transporter integral membrane type 1 [Penicillium cf. griseofulvum]
MVSTARAVCLSVADAALGPRVNVACRNFDFTVYFEDLFFVCLPTALFLLGLPTSLWLLWNEPRRIKRSTRLLFKIAALVTLFACQLAFLVLRRLGSTVIQTNASLAADVLEVVAISSAIVLSYIHHCRSIRPSTLLTLFLSARSLVGIARVRTLWLIPDETTKAIVFTIGFIFTFISLVFESSEKESIVIPETEKPATPEPFSGFWKQASFAWLAGTFRLGYSKVISVDDLPDLDPRLDTEVVAHKLQSVWSMKQENKSKKYALLVACFRAYYAPFISAVIPRLFLSGFTFCQPFLINATVSWVGNSDAAMDSGKALIGAYALTYSGMAVFTALYGYHTFRFTIRLRGGLISLIHTQTVRARAVDLGEITAITLMGTDVERIASGFRSIHEMWASLIDIAVAIFLLERQLGVACLVPAVIVIAAPRSGPGLKKVEDRLRMTSLALEKIKEVKMLGLSEKISSIIRGLRQAEVATSAVFRKLLIVRVVISNSPTDLAPIATFVVYTIIALKKHDQSILAAKAFTSMSLISLVTTPVLTFIQAIPAVIQCVGCFDRIQEYCSKPHAKDNSETPDAGENLQDESPGSFKMDKLRPDGSVIEFKGQDFGWDKNASPVLHDVRLKIPDGLITMIVGPIGCGKSTLIESILGETLTAGDRSGTNLSSVAYCAQIPWIQSRTISENIIGDRPMDKDWYQTVISSCGLERDITRLRQGGQTPVAGNGMTLSGGQKQRIALARALYSRSRLVLLDDVFSGIDSSATEAIARDIFSKTGLLRKMRTTVVFATHSMFLLQYADNIIVLEDGHILETGSLDSLKTPNSYIQELKAASVAPSVNSSGIGPSDKVEPSLLPDKKDEDFAEDELDNQDSYDDLNRQEGDFSVYSYYASASGRRTFISCLIFALFWAFCREFTTVWLDMWTAANAKSGNSHIAMYLGVYIAFGVATLQLHENVLTSTFRAPFQFFHNVDIGSITNRFSQDMDLIDMSLPIEVFNVIAWGCTCLVKLIILAVVAKYLAIVIPFAAALVYMTQKFYLRTSRQLRFLDIEAKAPLYTHFLELVSGAATVRAYKWQESFDKACITLLNLSQRPVYLMYCVQQCLGFFLDMLVAVLAVILVVTVVFLRDKFDPGDVGVALVMVMTFNSVLMQLIKDWTNMETSIGAVSRVKVYAATTELEESALDSTPSLPTQWPTAGAIEFSGVVARHSAKLPPSLKGISMSIRAGEKIAICGPSGSGKTTLILALLGMVQSEKGTICIDGFDLSDYSRAEARTKLNVITQDPFLVAGTVRFNVDPFEEASDDEIISALQKVRLWGKIEKEGGLDMAMKVTTWSQGQKQLLCLARAMVRKGKVLILDEATSSVDNETENFMQEIINTEFSTHTVLAVVHRLRFINHYDRIALLDNGTLMEFDSPGALMSTDSRFKTLHDSGNL